MNIRIVCVRVRCGDLEVEGKDLDVQLRADGYATVLDHCTGMQVVCVFRPEGKPIFFDRAPAATDSLTE